MFPMAALVLFMNYLYTEGRNFQMKDVEHTVLELYACYSCSATRTTQSIISVPGEKKIT